MQKSGSKAVTAKAVTAKTAAPVKQEATTAKAAVKPTEEPKQETLVFDTAEKAVEKKEPEKKAAAEKAVEKKTEEKAAEKKPAAKKAAAGKKRGRKPAAEKKAAEKVEEVYVQFAGEELLTKEVLERAKQAYVAEGHRESSIKSIRLYIKPEEHMAYYVINEKIAGGVPV